MPVLVGPARGQVYPPGRGRSEARKQDESVLSRRTQPFLLVTLLVRHSRTGAPPPEVLGRREASLVRGLPRCICS